MTRRNPEMPPVQPAKSAQARQPPRPKGPEEWSDAASALGILEKSVHDRTDWHSGSEATQEDFLSLRTIPAPLKDRRYAAVDLELGAHLGEAERRLAERGPFTTYLSSLEGSDASAVGNMGEFRVTKRQQVQILVLERPQRARPGLHSINEELVNDSSIHLLSAICDDQPDLQAFWTPHRASLKHDFQKQEAAPAIP